MRLLAASTLAPLQEAHTRYKELLAGAAQDPTIMPYRSKYQALEQLTNMQEVLSGLGEGEHQAALSSFVLSQSGQLKVEVEEGTAGEKLLLQGLETCDKVGEERVTLACRLAAHNQLGILWCLREDMARARQHLEKALNIYFNFRNSNRQEVSLWEHLMWPGRQEQEEQQEAGRKEVEGLVTHTYYYLAQVHGSLGNPKKSAQFCHETLARQLKSTYDPLDWVTNAAVLSQFYSNQGNYTTARYHLASARHVYEKHYDQEGRSRDQEGRQEAEEGREETEEAREKEEEAKEKVAKCCGLLARLEGKYGLGLLEESRRQEDSLQQVYKTIEEVESVEDEAVENPEFQDLQLGSRLECVTAARVTGWEEARALFLWSQKRLVEAQAYYTMEEKCTEYVELARDHSQLYRHLLHWEADPDRQAKMYRRRADLLEGVVRELSVTHYLLVIRQLRFELGEIYSDMMDLKRLRLQAEPNNPQVAKKVNLLVQQAVQQFSAFQDTMKVEGKLPEKYNEDSVRPALLTHFHLGRLASKLVVSEGSEQELRNVMATYSAYKEIVDYCQLHPDSVPAVEEEVEVCREMVRLMPVRIEKMRRELVK